MNTIELVVTFAAFAALIGSSVSLGRASKDPFRVENAAAAVILLMLFTARWALTTPMFVHANLHGPLLLDAPYDHPTQSFRNYGPFGVLAQGVVMHLIGADLTVVAMMNQLFAVLTVGLMGWVAQRWTGSRAAGLCVIAVAAFNPVLMRQGSSEDGHNLAVLLAWLAIAAMEQYAGSGKRAALVASAAAAALMIETRQILFAFVPVFPLLGLLRARFRVLRQWHFWAATGVMFAVLMLRIAASLQDRVQAWHISSIVERLSSFDAIALAITRHPMLDLRFATHLLPLYIIGAAWLIRQSWAGRFFVVAAVGLFASSLWLYEGQDVAFMFRMPVLTVGLFIAGLGAWSCAEFLLRRLSGFWPLNSRLRIPVYGAVAGALCFAPALQPGWAILGEVDPLTREYAYIKTMLPVLPHEITLVTGEDWRGPSYQFPIHLLEDAGIVIHQRGSDAPRIFLHGVYCTAYSMAEVVGFNSMTEALALPKPTLKRMVAALATTRPEGFSVPAVDRPECRRLLEGATPIGTPLRIPAFPQDPPFVLFGVDTIDLQFYRLPLKD